jgi:hypothetical protein
MMPTGAHNYLTNGTLRDEQWARYACPRGRFFRFSDAPSESGNHGYGREERQRPLPALLESVLQRVNDWRERAMKRTARFRQALKPTDEPDIQLVSKAEEYIISQGKVRLYVYMSTCCTCSRSSNLITCDSIKLNVAVPDPPYTRCSSSISTRLLRKRVRI